MSPDPLRGSRFRRSYLITPLNKYFRQYEHPSKNLSYAPGEEKEPASISMQRLFLVFSWFTEVSRIFSKRFFSYYLIFESLTN